MSIFKEATKNPKVLFNLGNGEVTVCDLWRYSLEKLDKLYGSLHQELETTKQVSLLTPKTASADLLELKLAVVKEVVETLLAEKQAQITKAAKAEQAKVIREKLADKRDQSLSSLSEEELVAKLKELEE